MNLMEKLRSSAAGPVLGASILGILAGCGGKNVADETRERMKVEEKPIPIKYEFTDFGEIANTSRHLSQMGVADFDGDGDLDIYVGFTYGGVIIYENKLPQKGGAYQTNE